MWKERLKHIFSAKNLIYNDVYMHTKLTKEGFSRAVAKETLSFTDMCKLADHLNFSLEELRFGKNNKKDEIVRNYDGKCVDEKSFNEVIKIYEARIKESI